jgi:hypothetical protein
LIGSKPYLFTSISGSHRWNENNSYSMTQPWPIQQHTKYGGSDGL